MQNTQPSVRPLLSSVSLPTHEQSGKSEQILVGAATPPAPDQLPKHWPAILSGLQSVEPLPALQEIDQMSNKKQQYLKHVSQHLYNLISSPSAQVRNLALILLLRYLKFNPNIASEVLPSVLGCLDSRNADIVNSILEKLPEIVTSMQEFAKIILTRTFNLGVNSNANISLNISKCLSLLSLQSGC